MASRLLRHFTLSTVLQISGDVGGAEAVAAGRMLVDGYSSISATAFRTPSTQSS